MITKWIGHNSNHKKSTTNFKIQGQIQAQLNTTNNWPYYLGKYPTTNENILLAKQNKIDLLKQCTCPKNICKKTTSATYE
jgi:hypothetical protein